MRKIKNMLLRELDLNDDQINEILSMLSTMNLVLIKKLGGSVSVSPDEWKAMEGKYLIESAKDSADNMIIKLISKEEVNHVNH